MATVEIRPNSKYLNLKLSGDTVFSYQTKIGKSGRLVLAAGLRQIDLTDVDYISFDDTNVTSYNQTDIKVFI